MAAPSVVQFAQGHTTVGQSSVTATFGSGTTSGNEVWVFLTAVSGGGSLPATIVTSITLGNSGDTFAKAFDFTPRGFSTINSDSVWVDSNCTGGKTVITVNLNSVASDELVEVYAYEVSGSAYVVDLGTANWNGNDSTSNSLTSPSSLQADTLWIGAIAAYRATTFTVTGPSSPWVVDGSTINTSGGGVFLRMLASHNSVTGGAGTVTFSNTCSSASTIANMLIAIPGVATAQGAQSQQWGGAAVSGHPGCWSPPPGVTSVTAAGIGSGGGGGTGSGSGTGGGGGGGGEYASGAVTVSGGTIYPLLTGAQAAAAADGSDTTFNTSGVVAKGGKKGANSPSGAGGAGGTGGTGSTLFDGGAGAAGVTSGGGGGSSAGTAAAGNNGSGSTGGSAPAGGGAGGTGGIGGTPPTNGSAPGGGGGGGSTASTAGATGAPGQLTLTFTVPSGAGYLSRRRRHWPGWLPTRSQQRRWDTTPAPFTPPAWPPVVIRQAGPSPKWAARLITSRGRRFEPPWQPPAPGTPPQWIAQPGSRPRWAFTVYSQRRRWDNPPPALTPPVWVPPPARPAGSWPRWAARLLPSARRRWDNPPPALTPPVWVPPVTRQAGPSPKWAARLLLSRGRRWDVPPPTIYPVPPQWLTQAGSKPRWGARLFQSRVRRWDNPPPALTPPVWVPPVTRQAGSWPRWGAKLRRGERWDVVPPPFTPPVWVPPWTRPGWFAPRWLSRGLFHRSRRIEPVFPGAPVITTTSLPNGKVSVAYTATLAGTGGVLPYTWSITVGTLPPGLSLNTSTGVISGTPTTAGIYAFTVELADAEGQLAVPVPLSINILATPTAGILVYSGTPASGNLIASMAPLAGTDPFGNAFPQGVRVQDPSTGQGVYLNPARNDTFTESWSSATASVTSATQLPSGASSEQVPGYLASVAFSEGGAAEQLGTLLTSQLTSEQSWTAMLLTAESADGSVGSSATIGNLTYNSAGNYTLHRMLALYPAVSQAVLGPGFGLFASQPGTDVTETWHNMSMQNSWVSNFFGEFFGGYAWVGLRAGCVAFRGVIKPTGSASNPFATLPAAYRPSNNVRWAVRDLTTPSVSCYGVLHADGTMAIVGGISTGDQIDIMGTVWIA